MSEVGQGPKLADTPVGLKLTAIQIIEQEVANYIKQHGQAVANIHAIEGAIQSGQSLLAKLKAEATKADNLLSGAGVQAAEGQSILPAIQAANSGPVLVPKS